MGFKDRLSGLGETVERLKQQAAVLADQAQQGYGSATARLDQYQAKKQADALLLELGGLVWADHQHRATAADSARVAAIMDELGDLEAKGVSVVVTPATPPPGSSGSWIPGGVGEPGHTVCAGREFGSRGVVGVRSRGGWPDARGHLRLRR